MPNERDFRLAICVFGISILLTALPIFIDLMKPDIKIYVSWIVALLLLVMGIWVLSLAKESNQSLKS